MWMDSWVAVLFGPFAFEVASFSMSSYPSIVRLSFCVLQSVGHLVKNVVLCFTNDIKSAGYQ